MSLATDAVGRMKWCRLIDLQNQQHKAAGFCQGRRIKITLCPGTGNKRSNS
jgi:hypothetical protein